MAHGRVKWFNASKGFGFILKSRASSSSSAVALSLGTSLKSDHSENLEEIFVHYSSILGEGFKSLHEGQEVEFDLYESEKGKIAQNVVLRDR